MRPISLKSSTWTPRVASAGVPIRRPLETIGGGGANGAAVRVMGVPLLVRAPPALPQAVLGLLAVQLGLAQVDEDQVHVGAAGEDADPRAGLQDLGRKRLCA